MNRNYVISLVGLMALFLLIIGSIQANDSEGTPVSNQPMIGDMAPAFSLMDLNDQLVTSDDLRGSYVVIHFAASW